MFGSFSEQALQDYYDFARCKRPDGTFYGTGGKCRKGVNAGAKPEEVHERKGAKKLYQSGGSVDIHNLDNKAEKWRKETGLTAFPMTMDWNHDRVHVLVHEFLPGGGKGIGKWIGEGAKSPTPAEETLVNMIHRAGALKGRGDDYKLSDDDLRRYFTRDIQFMYGRGNIGDQTYKLYFKTDKDGIETPDVDKFIQKYREIEKKPGFDKLLDAAHSSFTNVGEYVL